MTYTGHIKNGVVVLDKGMPLREGTLVRVEPIETVEPVASGDLPTLAERLKGFIGIVDDLPSDLAKNHDHYLHGLPKR